MAGSLRVARSRGRALVANFRRRLFPRGREARSRHQADRSRLETLTGNRDSAGSVGQSRPSYVSGRASVNSIEIYTDGACKGNPGPGGWGVLLISGTTEK